jgi:hypothetical protein
MSRGLGRVQNRCISAIAIHEGKGGGGSKGEPPLTTYDIAGFVYNIDDEDPISDAQHVAVKRALEGLQRKGMVIGFDRLHCGYGHNADDARSNHQHCWMTERWAQRLIREHEAKDRPVLVKTFKAKMRAIGMKGGQHNA